MRKRIETPEQERKYPFRLWWRGGWSVDAGWVMEFIIGGSSFRKRFSEIDYGVIVPGYGLRSGLICFKTEEDANRYLDIWYGSGNQDQRKRNNYDVKEMF